MKSRIAIAVSALTLGTALAAVPSFAQTRDRASGTVAPAESSSCVHFQQGCSDKPYPMGQNASPNSGQSSERTGTRENRTARSASGGERISGQRASGNRERLSSERASSVRTRVGERERLSGTARVSERARGSARVGERARTSDEYMRSAAPEPGGASERVASRESVRGETFGFGERRSYYDYQPGVEIAGAGAPSSAIALCQTRFRSFDPATGTYMGFDGIRHPCP